MAVAAAPAAVSFSSSSSAATAAPAAVSFSSSSSASAAAADGSPSSVRVLSPIPPRLPCWAAAAEVTEDQSFATAQWAARAAYERIFKPAYAQLPVTMRTYADSWSLNPDAVDQLQFDTRLKFLIVFGAHRDQAKTDLQAITEACNQAITYCAPFNPDSATMVWLAKLKISVAKIEANAKTTLCDNLAEIVIRKAEMTDMLARIEETYYNMKGPLEAIARRLQAARSNLVSNAISVVGRAVYAAASRNQTPLLDSLRNQLKTTLGIADPKGDAQVERTNQEIVDKLRQELNDANLNALGSVSPNAQTSTFPDNDNKEAT